MSRSMSMFRRGERPTPTGVGDLAGTLLEDPTARAQASPASHQAAASAKKTASYWRRMALQLYASGLELTPDEMAGRIDWTHERSIKPRISNLLQKGLLETTGERRPFVHGDQHRGPGDVLRITDYGLAEYRRTAR